MRQENLDPDMTRKIVMITGANSGIGKQTAIQLAKMKATVIMVCRNAKRGKDALQEIKKKSGSESVELFIADLSNQDSIARMTLEFKKKYDRLDVLINNAGLMIRKKTLTDEDFEITFAVNYLGHFILTNLLLDLMKKSVPSRIINVSSGIHFRGNINLDDINYSNGYSMFKAYSDSKLANILFTYALARRLEGTGVSANTLNPGVVRTNIVHREFTVVIDILYYALARLFTISPKRGAKTSVFLASSPKIENITGKYFHKSKPVKSSQLSYDTTLQNKLWELSEKLMRVG